LQKDQECKYYIDHSYIYAKQHGMHLYANTKTISNYWRHLRLPRDFTTLISITYREHWKLHTYFIKLISTDYWERFKRHKSFEIRSTPPKDSIYSGKLSKHYNLQYVLCISSFIIITIRILNKTLSQQYQREELTHISHKTYTKIVKNTIYPKYYKSNETSTPIIKKHLKTQMSTSLNTSYSI